MNILFSAYECNPYMGSEAYCGWAWVYNMSKYKEHNVYVLTRKRHKQTIDNFIKDNMIENIYPIYIEVPKVFTRLYSCTNAFYICYFLWQVIAYITVKKLNKRVGLDVIHHITLGDFRMIGFLPFINVPFIFGPVGGAQTTPKSLEKYVKNYKLQEKVREIINILSKYNPFYIWEINRAKKIYACNQETFDFLQNVIVDKSKLELMTENGVYKDKYSNIKEKEQNDCVCIMWAGRFLYRKGIELLLEAISKINTKKQYRVTICGDGPERQHIEKLIKERNLQHIVSLTGNINQTELNEQYRTNQIFVFPSLRETTGTVLFEAMGNKLAVVTLNQNGGKNLIDDNCGLLVNVDNGEDVASNLAKAVQLLIENDELRNTMGINANHKVLCDYTWETKIENMLNVYKKLRR